MRSPRISKDFVPVSQFKAQAAEWLRRAEESGAPVVVTQNGRPAAVVLSPAAYDELTERSRFFASINDGLADADAGRVHSHAQVTRRVSRNAAKRK